MASPLELLEAMHERMGDLAERVVGHLQNFQPARPQPAAQSLAAPLQPPDAARAVSDGSPQAAALPSPARFESFTPSPAPQAAAALTPPAPAAPASFAPLASAAPAPAAAAASAARPLAAPTSGASPLLSGGGADNGEVLAAIRELRDTLGAGGRDSTRPQGRTPPPPTNVLWSDVWEPRREGYAAASPSMDVSNIAGIHGASSSRGFASNPRGNRFLQPDIGTPR